MSNKTKTQKVQNKYKYTRTFSIIVAILIGIAIIPINLIFSKADVQWDMTPNKIYTADLSKTTLELLNSLDETINLYFAYELDDLIQGDDYDGRILKNAIEKYGENPHINLITGYPDDHPEIYSKFTEAGLEVNMGDIIVEGKNNYKKVNASSMFLTEYTESTDTTAFYFVGENYISGAIQYVKDGFEPSICFLRGHGEISKDEKFTTLVSMLKSYNYDIQDLNVSTGEIPENCKIIIVASPTSDFSKAETEKINTYLDNGGNIIFMMSPNDDTNEQYTNINNIMGSYGIYMDFDRVKETDEDMYYAGDPYTIGCYLNPSDFTTEAEEMVEEGYYVVMPPSRSFYAQSDDEDLISQPLIYTTTTAVGEPYGIEDYGDITNEQLILSAYCENPNRNSSKLLVFGNSEFITDEIFEQEYTVTTTSVFLSGIGWQYNSNVDLGIANRSYQMDYMLIDTQSKGYMVLAIMLTIPVLVIVLGIIIWLRRKNA
ncbi:MAG: Gldg family protein [Oscillospiraceae bacterium]